MMRSTIFVAMICALIPLASCNEVTGPGISATVTDMITGKPVAGAQVLVIWDGSLSFSTHGGGECYHVISAVTDDAGHFSVEPWRKSVPRMASIDYYRISVYRPQYDDAEGQTHGGIGRLGLFGDAGVFSDGIRLKLPPFNGTVKDRLIKLRDIRRSTRCPEAGASRRNATDFFRAMNQEVLALLATPEGRAIAEAEKAELAQFKTESDRLMNYRPLALDLSVMIESLQQAHDDELYERVAAPPPMPQTRSVVTTPEPGSNAPDVRK
jgi:hypothetical protein